MKVPFSWLKEYIDFDLTPEELGEKLVKSGFEVEGYERLDNGIQNVLTCRITKIERHPDADRLQVCHIDLGQEQTVIITAATNVFEGAVVPAALDGAWLFGGKRIFKSPLRGIMSNGMFCSGEELGIDDSVIAGAEADGILILPTDTPIGKDIKEILGMNEVVLDISVTSNRPDCQSILGIAREASAILGVPLKMPNTSYKTTKDSAKDCIDIQLQDSDLCSHYYGAVIKNIVLKESPKWMRDRLRYAGIRSINSIVDITNYVLTEIGQPMHAYDLRYVNGNQIIVRRAFGGEKLKTLDDKEFTLSTDNLVIADKKEAIGLAGVMGGKNSEIQNDTREIVFESARFARGNIRLTSRSVGQRTSASARFERGVDIGTVTMGMSRALALVEELDCGQIFGTVIGCETEPVEKRVIEVSENQINELLGIVVPTQDMIRILSGLDIKVSSNEDGVLVCEIPLNREDLENYTDIAEEIIRVYGYDRIVPRLPVVNADGEEQVQLLATKRCKATLVGLGCYETATYSFIEPSAYNKLCLNAEDARRQSIILRNPISEEMSVMRTTMAHNVLKVASYNLNRKNYDFRFFEMSRVFLPKVLPLEEKPLEETRLTVTVCGERESFFTIKGILNEVAADFSVGFGLTESQEMFLHPGKSADIMMKGKKIGYVGCVHPIVAQNYEIDRDVYFAELNLDALLDLPVHVVKFASLPRFQEIERDIALTVKDETKAGDMQKAIMREGGSILESVNVFDVYKGMQIADGYKSVALKLTFRSPDRTLVDEEVASIMTKIEAALSKKFDSKIRQ